MKNKYLPIIIILFLFQGISFSAVASAKELIDPSNLNPAATAIKVYPNPVSDSFFRLEYSLEKGSIIQVELYNIIGNRVAVFMHDFRQMGSHSESLELPQGLSSGTYLIRIESAGGISSQRLVIRSNNP